VLQCVALQIPNGSEPQEVIKGRLSTGFGVTVSSSVLHHVAVCCRYQTIVRCRRWGGMGFGFGFTVSCSVLQRVATCCSMLQVPNGSPVQKVGIAWALALQ